MKSYYKIANRKKITIEKKCQRENHWSADLYDADRLIAGRNRIYILKMTGKRAEHGRENLLRLLHRDRIFFNDWKMENGLIAEILWQLKKTRRADGNNKNLIAPTWLSREETYRAT